MAHPVVVHALGILGITHKARHVQTTVNFKLIANNADYGDVFPRPIAFFKNFITVNLAVFNLDTIRFTRFFRFAINCFQLFVLWGAFKSGHVARVQVKRCSVVVYIVVISNADSVFGEPLAQILVAHTQRLQGGDGRRVRVHALVVGAADVFSDEAPLGVCTSRVLDGWIHVDAK